MSAGKVDAGRLGATQRLLGVAQAGVHGSADLAVVGERAKRRLGHCVDDVGCDQLFDVEDVGVGGVLGSGACPQRSLRVGVGVAQRTPALVGEARGVAGVRALGCEIVKIVNPGGRGGPGGVGAPGAPGAPGIPGTPAGPGTPGVPGDTLVCAAPPEDFALARVAQDDDPPPTFSDAFFAITTTITASADGMTDNVLPIGIEDVCDVPQSLATQAAQLVGGDGVALISPATQVFDGTGLQLTGAAATTALAETDSLALKAQLLPVAGWQLDEDGAPVPTFSISRADIPADD